ncbi:hypothetical protein TNCT_166921 [Trichonephila clavata]|uniref:Uncharacterized protein n=1 Tax=Trichonephila clavata TaxID=2740835 RepID=A0A8X6J310_TRICU|nr:hypothetical protein TNCT_166921 [Trichonephila clavata]
MLNNLQRISVLKSYRFFTRLPCLETASLSSDKRLDSLAAEFSSDCSQGIVGLSVLRLRGETCKEESRLCQRAVLRNDSCPSTLHQVFCHSSLDAKFPVSVSFPASNSLTRGAVPMDGCALSSGEVGIAEI